MERLLPNLKLFLGLIFLSFLILILDLAHLLTLPKTLLSYLTNPISFGLYETNKNIQKQFYFIFLNRKAGQENRALKEQIAQLLSENATVRKKLAETESLISQDKYLNFNTYNLISAHPIGINRYLKIDKGASAGIKLGQAAVFNDNYLGKVVQVLERSSNVQLLSDPDSKVAAFSQGLEGKAKGVLLGQFGTDILMDKILHEENIKEGDLVYSEGIEEFLPRGLILGRVIQVLEQETQVFKQAKITPNFDIRDLELVFVLVE